MPVIYIDVVWLVNFVMDGVLLVTTGWIMRRPIRTGRIVLGALIGACYSLLLFFPSLSGLTTWPGKALVSLLMVGIGVKRQSWLDLARLCALFYFVSFVFAGAAIALHFAVPGVSLTKVASVSANGIAVETSMESLALLVAIPVGIALFKYIVRRLRQTHLRAGMEYRVHAVFQNVTIQCVGLVDSGNQLRDPISRRPVCFVDGEVMYPVLPKPIQTALRAGGDVVRALSEMTSDACYAFTLVPFRGAGGIGQLTIALAPDHLELEKNGHRFTVKESCLFAVNPTRLSVDNRFQAILHMELITGDEGFEADDKSETPQYETADSSATLVDSNSAQITRGR